MSHLAPFVAAMIRDKVVTELKQENDALTEEIRNSRKVQIVGPASGDGNEDSAVVYQEAQFDTDGKPHGNPNLWNVSFENQNGGNYPKCPLSHLKDVEILLGGIIKGSFQNNSVFECFLDDSDDDSDDEKEVSFCIVGCGQLWLVVNIHGWPIAQRDMNVRMEDGLNYLTGAVSLLPPEKTVTFKEVSFMVDGVRGLIDRLPVRVRAGVADAKSRQPSSCFKGDVLQKMRDAGNLTTGADLMEQANEIIEALTFFDIYYHESELYNTIVASLIRLQMDVRQQGRGDTFLDVAHRTAEQVAEHLEALEN